jgi:hypothetical protein
MTASSSGSELTFAAFYFVSTSSLHKWKCRGRAPEVFAGRLQDAGIVRAQHEGHDGAGRSRVNARRLLMRGWPQQCARHVQRALHQRRVSRLWSAQNSHQVRQRPLLII